MINKTFRRLALGAAAVTVAGVVVPVALASAANAAEPTSLAVNPTSQYVGVGNTGTAGTIPGGSPTVAYAVTLSPSTSSAANGVAYDVYSGPDANTTNPLNGTACTANSATSYTCHVAYNDVEGTDAIHFYVPTSGTAAAPGPYQAGAVTVNGTLVKGGPATSYTISPTSGNGSTDICVGYVVTGKDASGNPASGNVPATVTETVPTTAGAAVQFCDPTSTTFPATAEPSSTAGAPVPSGSTNTTYSATEGSQTLGTGSDYNFPTAGGTGVTPGSVKIGVSSNTAGTLNISAGRSVAATPTSAAVTPATATATISKGNTSAGTNDYTTNAANNNNASSLTLSPGNTTAFPNGTVSEIVTVKNSAGDALGGVAVNFEITSGPDKTTGPQACTSTTNGSGQTTCSFTASAPAAGASNTDALVVYVNQSTPASPTSGPDSGEPQANATVTVNNPTLTGGNGTNLKSNCDAAAKCTDTTATTSVPVTFTLKDDSGNPIAGAQISYTDAKTGTVTIASATPTSPLTTDANGQATVTLTVSGAANGDTVTVTGSTTQFTNTATDTATVTFATSGAAASVSLSPVTQVASSGSKVTETATVLDGFQKPVSGATVTFSVIGRNNPGNNTGATGSCTTTSSGTCSFTYTDIGTPVTVNTSDTVTASTTGASNATATVYYYTDTTANAVTTTYTAPGTSAGTCPGSNPSTAVPTEGPGGKFQTVCVEVTNAGGADLNGTPVTLNISMGSFVSSTGAPQSGTSQTENVGAQGQANYAVFYVQSATSGTQTLTATSGGKSGTASITYVNQQFNPVTPVRLVDTRIGQGGVSNGPLAPNTAYTFNLDNTNAPQGAVAYVFNVTAIHPSGQGNLRIGPSSTQFRCFKTTAQVPQASLINYQTGTDVANDVIVPNTGCDQFTLYSAGASADVAIDLQGYYQGGYTNVTPTRYVDTRPGSTNQGGTTGPIAANSSASFTLAGGAANVPPTATAVAINVTAIGPTGLGNLRVYPDGATVPTTSNINYIPGVDKAAFAVIQLPKDGKIDVYSAGSPVNVAIDVFGYFDSAGASAANVVTQAPVRVFDSRSGTELQAGVPVNVPVTAPGAANGVPASATAVLVSVTSIHAADSTGVGNLRVYPAGLATPTVSNVNYVSATTDVANFAIVPIGANGQITLYSAGSNINAAVDILGYVPAGS